MLETANPLIDIDALIERVRLEVERRRTRIDDGIANNAGTQLISPGMIIRFDEKGNAAPFLGNGWSHAESEHCWTDSDAAILHFEIPERPVDLLLSFTVTPILAPDITAQTVTAEWNGVPIGQWAIDRPGTFHTIVWSRLQQESRLVSMCFRLPNALRPLERNLGKDGRKLALAFRELTLRPTRDLGF